MRRQIISSTLAILAVFFLPGKGIYAIENEQVRQYDYLAIVTAYADLLIEQGRDTYGDRHTPLFAAALDREKLTLGHFPDIEGIRNHDRCTSGANPMHDQNLYQILYALTKITADQKYTMEADKSLKFFFENCQSPTTGLLAWGEHMGWDFSTEGVIGNTHEFFRPWVLWDRCYQLAPEAVVTYARGLWDHQISNHETGEFSRHAGWSNHSTGGENEYPRHGGFYITAWAKVYKETNDEIYANAVATLIDMYNRLSSKDTGAIPCSTKPNRRQMMWPESNLSLAVDITEAATVFPKNLKNKMLQRAAKTDEVYLSLKHDFCSNGIGFVASADIHTLQGNNTHTLPWATGYGKATDAQIANLCYVRYSQLAEGPVKQGYRQLIFDSADRYLTSIPELAGTVFPGPMGDVILHMLDTYEISRDKKYLDRANFFAGIAIESFLTEGSALPRASSKHDHYEAITRGDTMMLALLKLWQVEKRSNLNMGLMYTDR